MRYFYSLAWWLALPLVLARLWWRGRKEPGYRRHLAERLGFYRRHPGGRPLIWLHAVSVGETRAAEPLIAALLSAYPAHAILLTHMTPTGRATGKALFEKYGDRVQQSYMPYDITWMVARFLRHFSPRISILMETEVWPNAIAACVRYRVPVALVNARLSARSLAKAQRLGKLMTETACSLAGVAAQTEADAERLRGLGAPEVKVTGSVKFDVTPPLEMIDRGRRMRDSFGARPVFLCASTRDGEEAAILDAWLSANPADILLVVVPRHPQRFDEVAKMIEARGLNMRRRSSLKGEIVPPDVQVVLGDTMGEMFAYYAASDIAFIGGSLMPLGGQNLIEACAVGKPVLIGPHTFNFAAASEDAIAAGAALRVESASRLVSEAERLLRAEPERQAMADKALAFARQHRGATGRTLELLRPLIR